MNFSEMKHLRREYKSGELLESDLHANPFTQFDRWFRDALNANVDMADAMTLATVSVDHMPSARIVALRSYDERGFVFHTNYKSDKAVDIANNPHVALVFYWKELDRQIRILGAAQELSKSESDDYFTSRPLESNIVQSVSRQSQVVASKEDIRNRIDQAKRKHAGTHLARPRHWGGYCIIPTQFEFWQGGLERLHDRLKYRYEDNAWSISRLEP